ncbi:LysR family transcriptional regulator [Deinococcus oregonensis]|uniref:LysR family transcriptional regulator n=1 Tax=Deinococcus oregonensis TaxID=1805970 RepID=A0ABV6B4N7_9DEIO
MTDSRGWQPSLAQLRALVAVTQAGSFSQAAATLGVTQSGLSHAVVSLEAGLGCSLLTRTRRGVTVTAAGERVVGRAREILALVETLPAEVATPGEVTGTVRLVCFRSVATHLLPIVLHHLSAEHPRVHVEVDDGCLEREEVERAVLSGKADLGIAQLPVHGHLQVWPLASDPYVLVVPQGMKAPTGPVWEALAELPYIELQCSGALSVVEACVHAGFHHRPAMRLREDSSILALVARGAGFSILPRLAVEPVPAGVAIWPLGLEQRRELGVVVLPGVGRRPAVRALRQLLRSQIGLTPGVVQGLLQARGGQPEPASSLLQSSTVPGA